MVEGAEDCLEDAFCVLQHFIVPEASDVAAFGSEPGRACSVLLHGIGMLAAVDFHDQPFGLAVEVKYIWSELVLAAEFESPQLPVGEMPPDRPFRIRHLSPQVKPADDSGGSGASPYTLLSGVAAFFLAMNSCRASSTPGSIGGAS